LHGVSTNHDVTLLVMKDLPEYQANQRVAACAEYQYRILGLIPGLFAAPSQGIIHHLSARRII